MTPTVPLISSGIAGPLGITHLPRMWLKALLHTRERLPAGYYCATRGFDAVLLEGLGIDAATFVAYVGAARPDYRTFEAWVGPRAAARPDAVAAASAAILGREKPPERAAEDRTFVGLADPAIRRGFLLNNLDDWQTVHLALESGALGPAATIVPAVSSRAIGPLGAWQLARLWMRERVRTAGALPPDEPEDPLDAPALAALGLDGRAVRRFLGAERPTYVAFEAWVRAHARDASAAAVAAHNAALAERLDAILAADLRDWDRLHAQIDARELGA